MKKEVSVALRTMKKVKNWYTFYRIHQGRLKNDQYLIKLRNNTRFFIRGNVFDAGALREVVIQNHYRLENIKKGDVVVDIGAHIGTFSIMAARKAGLVVSYEPVPENIEMLKKNTALNSLSNIRIVEKAVSDKNEKKTLAIEPTNYGGHSFFGKEEKKIKIDAVSMKQVFIDNKLEKIDVLKMDCEGAEYEILLKISKPLLKKINSITMEYHTIENHDVSELENFLKENDFSVETVPLSKTLGQLYAKRKV